MHFIDSHCHFDFPLFDDDRGELWRKCNGLGIQQLVIPGVDPRQWQQTHNVCEKLTGLYFALGLHPYWLETCSSETLDEVAPYALASPYCVAIGESGLDGTRTTPFNQQLAALNLHLQLALDQDLPIILHCVKAHNELLRAVKKYPAARGVIHAFSGSYEMAMQWLELGFYLGIGGTITYPRANKTRSAVAQIPLQHVLLETDAPDMPLAGHQGERNSPLQLITVAETLAQLKNIVIEEIANQTSHNSQQLFCLPKTA